MEKQNKRRSKVEIVDNAVDNIFDKYDENHDDNMTLNEFIKMIDDLHLHPKLRMHPNELKAIFELMDLNHDGKVSK
jgi:Ca2+-binding EF-hand superfamily protein